MNLALEQLKSKVPEIDEKVSSGEDVYITLHRGSEDSLTLKIKDDSTAVETASERIVIPETQGATNVFDIDLAKLSNISHQDVTNIIQDAVSKSSQMGEGDEDDPIAKVTYIVVRKEWILLEACTYKTGNWRITAPKDFPTDLASVPKFLWSLVSSFELSLEAPLFHDLLYRCGGNLPDG